MKLLFPISIATMTLLGGTVQADQDVNCDAYAGAAVTQQAENVTLGCGYTSGGWSSDYAAHRDWCIRDDVHMADLTSEDRSREGALAICRTKAQACDNYTTVALLQNRYNDVSGCGFTGGRWSEDSAGHRAWCMSVAPEISTAETDTRAAALGDCQSQLQAAEVQTLTQAQQQAQQLMNEMTKQMQDASGGVLGKIGG